MSSELRLYERRVPTDGETSVREKLFLGAVTLLFLILVGHRVRQYASTDSTVTMPEPVATQEEAQLHLVPGGRYTLADIDANGRMVPSQTYRGFEAQHDFQPQLGDRLCPVTRTKSNPKCTWQVAGQVYEFCCPPCIDEFVRRAKEQPDQIQHPNAYLQ
jgi:hypothetical protein